MAHKETSKDRAVAARNARREERKKHESEQLTRDTRLGEERRDKAAGKTTENGSAKSGSASTSSPAGPSTPARAQAPATPTESPSAPITSAPAFLVAFAQRINKLQEQRKKITGGPGIEVKVSSGNTVISALDGTGGGGGTSDELHFNDGTIDIDIDENGIKLLNIASGDYAKMYTTGALGVFSPTGSTKEVLISPSDGSLDITNGSISVTNGTKSIVIDENGITMTDTAGAGKSLAITFAALLAGKSVSLRVDDYCDAGVDKSQQHLASAPYV